MNDEVDVWLFFRTIENKKYDKQSAS